MKEMITAKMANVFNLKKIIKGFSTKINSFLLKRMDLIFEKIKYNMFKAFYSVKQKKKRKILFSLFIVKCCDIFNKVYYITEYT